MRAGVSPSPGLQIWTYLPASGASPFLTGTFLFQRVSTPLKMFVFFLRKRLRDFAKTNMNSKHRAFSVGRFSGQTDLGLNTIPATS